MKNLLKFEFRHLFKQKALYICIAGVVAFCFIVILTSKLLSASGSSMEGNLSRMQITGSFFLLNAISQSKLEVFTGIFIAIFVCNDFGEGTIRGIISRGFSRRNVFIAKYISCIVASFCLAIIGLIVGFGFGTIFGGIGDDWSIRFFPLITAQILTVFAYASLFVFFSLLFKKLGGAITVAIILPIALPLLLTLMNAIFTKSNFDFTNLWLSGCMTSLANPNIESKSFIISLIIPSLYIFISDILSLVFFKKAEV